MDSLKDYQPKESTVYLKFRDGDEVKLRVLTLDPLVSEKVWPNAPDQIDVKYAFVVWNWNENKAQVLQVGPGLLNRFTRIHRDDDFEPLNKLDIKITATGEMLERRYEVQVLPKAQELSPGMVKEASGLKLEELISDSKGRLSEFTDNPDDLPSVDVNDDLSGYAKAKATARKIDGKTEEETEAEIDELVSAELGDEEIDLSAIPF